MFFLKRAVVRTPHYPGEPLRDAYGSLATTSGHIGLCARLALSASASTWDDAKLTVTHNDND